MGEKRFRALQTDRTAGGSRRERKTPRQTPQHTPNTRTGHDHLHIFSHPDYDRRLWHRTRSADPVVWFVKNSRSESTGARGLASGCEDRTHTAGGELHPALKTY